MIYMLTSGEYSDYGVWAHIEGPDEIDIEPYLDQAKSETHALYKEYARLREIAVPWVPVSYPQWRAICDQRAEWEKENPPPPGIIHRLLDMLPSFREVNVTEVHDYKVQRD